MSNTNTVFFLAVMALVCFSTTEARAADDDSGGLGNKIAHGTLGTLTLAPYPVAKGVQILRSRANSTVILETRAPGPLTEIDSSHFKGAVADFANQQHGRHETQDVLREQAPRPDRDLVRGNRLGQAIIVIEHEVDGKMQKLVVKEPLGWSGNRTALLQDEIRQAQKQGLKVRKIELRILDMKGRLIPVAGAALGAVAGIGWFEYTTGGLLTSFVANKAFAGEVEVQCDGAVNCVDSTTAARRAK